MKTFFKKIVVSILLWEARAVIKKHKPAIIAITGSVGKTSTKDAAYHILASAGVFVRKSEKSFNSEIGVPLTILGLQNAWNSPIGWVHNIVSGLGQVYTVFGNGDGSGARGSYPKCLVLEVGADHPGDIESLTRWLRPDIAAITAVSKIPVHVEFFPSPEAVLKEKLALARGVRQDKNPEGVSGKLVLPANDPSILAVRADVPNASCLTFAVDSGEGSSGNFSIPADVTASSPEIMHEVKDGINKPVGMSFVLAYKNNGETAKETEKIESAKVSIMGVAGTQHIHSIAAASAIALSYGIGFDAVVAAIPKYKAPLGRMNIIEGIVGTTLIDDTYNSSPDAVREALKVLGSIKAGRKIAVLGDMMELGKFSTEEHRKAGERVAEAFGTARPAASTDFADRKVVTDLLITVGIRARDIGEGAINAGLPVGSVHNFDTSVEAGEWLRNLLHKESLLRGDPGSVILIKGSQSPRLERITFALLADQSHAADLLVRQDAEWLAKK